MATYSMSRRDFGRLFAMGGSAAILSHQTLLGSKRARRIDPITSVGAVGCVIVFWYRFRM